MDKATATVETIRRLRPLYERVITSSAEVTEKTAENGSAPSETKVLSEALEAFDGACDQILFQIETSRKLRALCSATPNATLQDAQQFILNTKNLRESLKF